jgi:hypothetical protein
VCRRRAHRAASKRLLTVGNLSLAPLLV